MSGEFGTGKTIFVLAIVVGCFAVLWPKIFYPMLTASVKHPTSSRQESMGGHARPERPAHLYPEMMHPALREKGRAMPQRTIDKQARPGPMPGVRPPMGGAGGMVPPPQGKGSGAMGIIMPLYTVGIVVFFVYTIMKVLFKKGPDDDKTPKLKDFGLDPEYRKYVFAEEYLDNSEFSTRDQMRRQAREESRSRRKVQQDQMPDTKIGQRRMPNEGRMDTQGKKLGEWYLPEGFLDVVDEDSEYEDTIGGTTFDECIQETVRSRLQEGIHANTTNSRLRKCRTLPKHEYENLDGNDDDCKSFRAQKDLPSMPGRKKNPLHKNIEYEDDYLPDEGYSCSNDFLKLIEEKLKNYDGGSDLDNFKELFLMAQEHIKIKQQMYTEAPREQFSSEHTRSSEDETELNYCSEESTSGVTGKSECDKKDEQLDHLRRRLEETEKAMERLMCQMGSVTDKLSTAKITEVLSQAQAQAKILKDEVGDITSEEELTSSEALTTTMSEDNSLPTSLQQHLHALQVEQLNSYSELSVDVVPQQEGEQVPSTKVEAQLDLITDEGDLGLALSEQTEVTVDPASHQSTVDTVAPCKELEVEISEPQVNVDVPQMEEVAHITSPSPKQTDIAQEEGNEELDHEAEEQAVAPADVEKDQIEVVEPEEAMPAEPKEVEPSVEPKEDEAEAIELEEAETQAAEPNKTEPQTEEPKDIEQQFTEPSEVEPQSEEPKEIEQQPAEPLEVEKPSAESKEAEEPEQSTEPKDTELPPAEVATEEQNVDLPLETKQPVETDAPAASQELTEQQNIQAEIVLPKESKVPDEEDNVLKVRSEEAEQKQAEPVNICEETPATKDSTTCIMTFISDTADDQNLQQGKFFSDDKQQKEDPGTPDEAEASPAPLLKEITTGTPKRSPDDAQGANAEAEDSSEATETGADISELKSFAEESHGHEKALVAEEIPVPIPEEEYCPSIRMGLMDEAASEDSAVLCKGQGTQTSLALSLTPPQAVSKEHSTQTDEEQGVAVLGVQTSFLHDEGGVETRAGSHGPVKTEGVTEILLDALLPSETQLLIKDTQVVGSKPSQNVEIDASEAEGVPCIVTSHVSLAFLGLDSQKPESLTAVSVNGKKTENVTTVTAKPGSGTAQTPISQESKTDCEHNSELVIDKNKVTEVQVRCEKDIPEAGKYTEESVQTGKETEFVDRSHTAPETSDQFSKDDKSALQELEAKEVQKEAGNEPLPDSPSLEAIAEAVAAATTRAALDLLATTNSDTLIKPQEVQEAASSPSISSLPKTADTKVVPSELGEEARKPSEQVTEASRSQTQSDASQPTTVYVATVTHTPSPSPTSTPEKEKTQESVEADLMKASVPQGEIPAETSKTDAASPVPISQDVVVTKTVEAALAEAAEEVCDINTNKDTKHQDTTATQDHQGVATVSPNEDSPTSSKGSSPDMEEYEVINKDEDTAHKLRTQRETSGGEPVVDKVKAAESTEVSSQAAQLHTDEEGASKKDTEPQKEEKVVTGKERSSSKEPEEKKSSDKTNVCEDQGKDSTPCPVDDSSAKATDPQATVCMPSESLVAEEGQTDIDSSTLKESVSSDNADSE